MWSACQIFCVAIPGTVTVTGVGYGVSGRMLLNGTPLAHGSSTPVVRLLEVGNRSRSGRCRPVERLSRI
jgi:hypothetical protein